MASLLKRAALVATGLVLGVAAVAGGGAWRARASRPEFAPAPPPPGAHRTVAPGTRV